MHIHKDEYSEKRGEWFMGSIIGFVVWVLVDLIFLFVGISAWNKKEPVGFFTFVSPPKVSNVTGYNHSVAKLWFFFATVMLLLGLPMFAGQNSPLIIISIIGLLFLVIAVVIIYLHIEEKYREK